MEDWFEKLSKEEREEIETGLIQAEKKELTDHDEVMKVFLKYKKQIISKD